MLEERLQEILDEPLEVGKRRVLVHEQPLDLVKHGGVREVRVAAVDAARADNTQGRLAALHDPHLYRRGVRAQHHALVHKKGVVFGPGRVVRRKVERLEVVVVVLDLGALGNLEAHSAEEVLHALDGPGHGVQTAGALAAAGQRDVDGLGGEALGHGGGIEGGLALGNQPLQLFLHGVDARSGGGALLCRQLAEALEKRRHPPFLPR